MPKDRGDEGQYVETVTVEDVLDTFDAVPGPVILSADVADRYGCSRQTARRKLEELYNRGELDRRKVARRMIYWRDQEPSADDVQAATERATPQTRRQERREGVESTSRTSTRDQSGTESSGDESPTEKADTTPDEEADEVPDYSVDVSEVLEEAVRDHLRLEVNDPRKREALLKMWLRIRENNRLRSGELKELYSEYGDGYNSKRSWWNTVLHDFPDALPGVVGDGSGWYRYEGDDATRDELA